MSLAADHLVANIVHDSSQYRELRLQRPGERAREDGSMGDDDGQMLTNEDLALRWAATRSSLDTCFSRPILSFIYIYIYVYLVPLIGVKR